MAAETHTKITAKDIFDILEKIQSKIRKYQSNLRDENSRLACAFWFIQARHYIEQFDVLAGDRTSSGKINKEAKKRPDEALSQKQLKARYARRCFPGEMLVDANNIVHTIEILHVKEGRKLEGQLRYLEEEMLPKFHADMENLKQVVKHEKEMPKVTELSYPKEELEDYSELSSLVLMIVEFEKLDESLQALQRASSGNEISQDVLLLTVTRLAELELRLVEFKAYLSAFVSEESEDVEKAKKAKKLSDTLELCKKMRLLIVHPNGDIRKKDLLTRFRNEMSESVLSGLDLSILSYAGLLRELCEEFSPTQSLGQNAYACLGDLEEEAGGNESEDLSSGMQTLLSNIFKKCFEFFRISEFEKIQKFTHYCEMLVTHIAAKPDNAAAMQTLEFWYPYIKLICLNDGDQLKLTPMVAMKHGFIAKELLQRYVYFILTMAENEDEVTQGLDILDMDRKTLLVTMRTLLQLDAMSVYRSEDKFNIQVDLEKACCLPRYFFNRFGERTFLQSFPELFLCIIHNFSFLNKEEPDERYDRFYEHFSMAILDVVPNDTKLNTFLYFSNGKLSCPLQRMIENPQLRESELFTRITRSPLVNFGYVMPPRCGHPAFSPIHIMLTADRITENVRVVVQHATVDANAAVQIGENRIIPLEIATYLTHDEKAEMAIDDIRLTREHYVSPDMLAMFLERGGVHLENIKVYAEVVEKINTRDYACHFLRKLELLIHRYTQKFLLAIFKTALSTKYNNVAEISSIFFLLAAVIRKGYLDLTLLKFMRALPENLNGFKKLANQAYVRMIPLETAGIPELEVLLERENTTLQALNARKERLFAEDSLGNELCSLVIDIAVSERIISVISAKLEQAVTVASVLPALAAPVGTAPLFAQPAAAGAAGAVAAGAASPLDVSSQPPQ